MKMYIRPSDFRELLNITSPVMAFLVPWLVVLIGQQLALCRIIVPVYSSFYLIVIGNMITSLAIAFIFQLFLPQKIREGNLNLKNIVFSKNLKKTVFNLISVYLILQLFQVIYFGGFPLIWLALGIPKTYFDYGLASLNGFLNAIYLLSTTLFFLIYLKEKKSNQLLLLIFLIVIPVFLVSRQLFMSAFLQIACCLLLYNPKILKKVLIGFFGLLAAFIIVGNIRTGIENLVYLLGPKDYIPPFLYSLLWVYAYIVTPFNNINAGMDSIQPLGYPFHELSSLLPSVLRSQLNMDNTDAGYTLVNAGLNVSSFYLSPILDFGGLYAFFFMASFQVILYISYKKALKATSWIEIVEYSIFYMVMVLSIFTNLFLFLPILFQIIIIKIAKWRIYYKQGFLTLANNRFF